MKDRLNDGKGLVRRHEGLEWVEHIGHQTFCEGWLIAALFPLQVLDHVLYD